MFAVRVTLKMSKMIHCVSKSARLKCSVLAVLLIFGMGFNAQRLSYANAAPEIPHSPITNPQKTRLSYHDWHKNLVRDIKSDFSTYFVPRNLLILGNVLVAAGISANTSLDRSIRDIWQQDIHTTSTRKFFNVPNFIGGLSYWYLPIFGGAMGFGFLADKTEFGHVCYNWGYRSMRTYMVAAVQQLPLAIMLGSGRPSQGKDSKWRPFRDTKGVSGHATIGAVPFLTAAHMVDSAPLRYTLYAISTLPGLARLENNSHYFSQVLLGWSIAFLSSRAIYESDFKQEAAYQMSVYPRSGGAMLSTHWRF